MGTRIKPVATANPAATSEDNQRQVPTGVPLAADDKEIVFSGWGEPFGKGCPPNPLPKLCNLLQNKYKSLWKGVRGRTFFQKGFPWPPEANQTQIGKKRTLVPLAAGGQAGVRRRRAFRGLAAAALLLASVSAFAAGASRQEPLEVVPVSRPIAMDGQFDDWPAALSFVITPFATINAHTGPASVQFFAEHPGIELNRAELMLAHDPASLYLGIRLENGEPSVNTATTPADWHRSGNAPAQENK